MDWKGINGEYKPPNIVGGCNTKPQVLILQHLDVACFGPFSRQYHFEAKQFMSDHPGHVIRRYNMAEIASNPNAYGSDKIGFHALFGSQTEAEDISDLCPNTVAKARKPCRTFLSQKTITVDKVKTTFVPPIKRKTLRCEIAGKPVTEESVVKDIIFLFFSTKTKQYKPDSITQKRKSPNIDKGKGKGKKMCSQLKIFPPF